MKNIKLRLSNNIRFDSNYIAYNQVHSVVISNAHVIEDAVSKIYEKNKHICFIL